MVISRSLPLSIAVAVLCCSLYSPPLPAAAAAKGTELITRVCRNITDFAFCCQSFNSDPRATTANQYVLAYIALDNAYANATDTRKYIAGEIMKSHSFVPVLKRCLGCYDQVVRALTEVQGDLDSETYADLGKLAMDVGNSARACGKAFNATLKSPLTTRNGNLIKLANICYVVFSLV